MKVLRRVQHVVPVSRATCSPHRRSVSPSASSEKVPMSAKILTGMLRATEVPFSSYLAFPRTPLHFVDARIKQIWLIAMLVLIPRVLWQFRVGLAAAVLVLSLICLPKRLSSAQLRRLLPLCAFLFVGTAFSADQIAMAAPVHTPPPELVGLPSLEPLNDGYKYVLCKFFFITVSRFSLSLAATIACVSFAALQLTSLFLLTTPPESAAAAFRWFAAPLRLFCIKVDTLTFQLLLSLRFVSLVFEEVRNLCLGLASRGVVWPAMTRSDVVTTWILMFTKLFGNLFERSSRMAESLTARGFKDPEERYLNVPLLCPSKLLPNSVALIALGACISAAFWFHKSDTAVLVNERAKSDMEHTLDNCDGESYTHIGKLHLLAIAFLVLLALLWDYPFLRAFIIDVNTTQIGKLKQVQTNQAP